MTANSGVTISQMLALARSTLADVTPSARLDAELLLARVLGLSRASLFAWPDRPVDRESEARYRELIARRAQGEPIAYLLGTQEFWSLELIVTPATLIPRPETELLVEAALERLPGASEGWVVDVGTGSGAIALAIARERPFLRLLGVDISRDALQVAVRNRASHQLGNAFFCEGRWLNMVMSNSIDMVVSNPPYVAASDPHLTQGDVRFEPRSALISGTDGLDDIRQLITDGQRALVNGGWLILEHGWDQGPQVQAILRQHGFRHVALLKDLAGHDRVSLGQK